MEITQNKQISSVMQTALENIKDMIDVNTVIGEAVIAGNGNTVIPVSKVSFGFVHMLPAQNLLPWEHTIAMLPRLIGDMKAIFSSENEGTPEEKQ